MALNPVFQGQLKDSNSKVLSGVTVTAYSTVNGVDTVLGSTTTDSNGRYKLVVRSNIDTLKDNYKVTFTKNGLETKVITKPNQSSTIKGYIDPVTGGTLDLQGYYPSGKYKISSLLSEQQSVINHELEDMLTFIKSNPDSVTIKISASESLPTNYDREEGSPNNGKQLAKGQLAMLRAKNLEEYITSFLERKKSEDPSNNFTYTILPITTQIGVEKYNSSVDDPKDEKYTKEQWIRVDVEVDVSKNDCFRKGYLVIDISYNEKLRSVQHNCNNAMFELYANGILLKRDDGKPYANLNNAPNDVTVRGNIKNDNIAFTDNAFGRYHENNVTGPFKGQPENPGRFKQKEEGKSYTRDEIITKPSPSNITQNVTTVVRTYDGGLRFNRFVLDVALLDQITQAQGLSYIDFTIKCINPFNIEHVNWKDGCHKGAGAFNLYRVEPDGDKFKVTYSYELIGQTPSNRNQESQLFRFNPCSNTVNNIGIDLLGSLVTLYQEDSNTGVTKGVFGLDAYENIER